MPEVQLTQAPISSADADRFVAGWIAAFNAHDVEAVVAHYHPEVEYYSPFIVDLVDPSGRLVGRDALGAYLAAAFERFPDLHFEPPLLVASGVGSITFHYRSVRDLHALETLVFGPDGLVVRAHCQYR